MRARADVALLAVGALGDETGEASAPRANKAHLPELLHRHAVLEGVLAQHPSYLVGELGRELEVRILIGVATGLIGEVVEIDLDGRVRSQITAQSGDLLEVVGGIVRVVTDGQPDMPKREVDVVVADRSASHAKRKE
jgi:hypothetical protein